jgi:hypothetical protein
MKHGDEVIQRCSDVVCCKEKREEVGQVFHTRKGLVGTSDSPEF